MLMLGGCSVYNTRYAYTPAPVDVATTRPGDGDGGPVRTLISVIGVRREDPKSELPASVEVRFRVENTSSHPVTFDPATLTLYSAGLEPFPDPIVRPGGPIELPPDGVAVVEAYFPLAGDGHPSAHDLNGLNVRWTLDIDGEPVTSSASFTRRPVPYYERYHYHIGVGYHRFDC